MAVEALPWQARSPPPPRRRPPPAVGTRLRCCSRPAWVRRKGSLLLPDRGGGGNPIDSPFSPPLWRPIARPSGALNSNTSCALDPLVCELKKTVPSGFTFCLLSSLENTICYHAVILKNPKIFSPEPSPPVRTATYQKVSPITVFGSGSLWNPPHRAVMTSPSTLRFSTFILPLFLILLPRKCFFSIFCSLLQHKDRNCKTAPVKATEMFRTGIF